MAGVGSAVVLLSIEDRLGYCRNNDSIKLLNVCLAYEKKKKKKTVVVIQ